MMTFPKQPHFVCHSLATVLMMFVAVMSLSSCGSNEGDDIDHFIAESGKDVRGRVEPIPEVKPYIPFDFNKDGEIHDPFKPRKAESAKSNVVQPDSKRPKEPLEAFPLESLKYVGVLYKPKLKFALILPPDGVVQEVKIGNYLGQNFGLVTDITENAVMLKEIVQDEVSGDWVERSSSISLQE